VRVSGDDPAEGSPPAEQHRVTSVGSAGAPSGSLSRRPVQAMQATLAARRYFIDGWTIKQIASELEVSRFKAARLLDWARAEGIVKIEIVNTARSDVDLSSELRTAFGLRDAVVVAGLDGGSDAVGPELAEMAALVVAEIVTASDVVGVSWGRTLDLVVERLPSFHANSVVQLVGGFATLESASGGVELVRQLAAKASTTGYPLLAPLRVRDRAADALRQDPVISQTLGLMDQVTVVVAGVGSWGQPPASRMIECFDQDEVEALRERGTLADLCGFLLDTHGVVVDQPEDERIGISLGQLNEVGTVLAICGGAEKRQALGATLRSGLVDILVTDAGSAGELLASTD
jgi:DNA-binding transcriptional regulator LsrR (DeoR family)